MATLLDSGALRSAIGTNEALDDLLGNICVALQISASHYDKAQSAYLAVGRWLADDDSPLAVRRPRIYPQGSMALQTTIRPRTDDDTYDLDLVLEMDSISDHPFQLYQDVDRRLRENATYEPMIERKRRCLCLNYSEDDGVFHLDILPARRDHARGSPCIEVPDRTTKDWQPSNPLGYVAWFNQKASLGLVLERLDQAPLPNLVSAQEKPILKRVVQLLKRRRDVLFDGAQDFTPRSVVLTTLAGEHYNGEQTLTGALLGILDRIVARIASVGSGRIVVCNPTNPDEQFCESFRTTEHYDRFVEFIRTFRDEMIELVGITGLPVIGSSLRRQFGENVTRRVLMEYANHVSELRDAGTLRVSAVGNVAALMTERRDAGNRPPVIAPGIVVPRNTFFGK